MAATQRRVNALLKTVWVSLTSQEALLKTLVELVREQTSTQWSTKGARKIDNLLAESIKAHGGKLMDVSENLLEKTLLLASSILLLTSTERISTVTVRKLRETLVRLTYVNGKM